jgi:hypothetical protein
MTTDADKEGDRPAAADGVGHTTRRAFLKAAVTVSALPIVGSAAPNAVETSASARPLSLYKAIFDERFAAGRSFGARARQIGVATHGIRADITDVWFNDLYLRWRKGAAAVAGLTAPAALFCLERLAWDHGMRVVFQAVHCCRAEREVQHTVSRGHALVTAAHLDAAGAGWVSRLAELFAHYPSARVASVGPASLSWAKNDNAVTLTSWVIAPVRRA